MIKHPVTFVWLLLVGATGVSWWMGVATTAEATANWATVSTALILVAFIKVRFVIRFFMEVRQAPLALKLVTDAWVVVVCAAILVLYWYPH